MLGASLAWAAPPADNPAKPDNPPKADAKAPAEVSDADFVKTASGAFLAEINLGRMATEQAGAADVKQFGQHMVDAHTKTLEELDQAADKAGIAPAKTMDEKAQDLAKKLSTLKGDAFDKEYVPNQVAAHKAAIGLFEAESKDGKNEDLKAVAAKILPVLKHHLEMAEKLPDANATKPEKASTDTKPSKDK